MTDQRAARVIATSLAAILLLPATGLAQGTAADPLPEAGTELEPGRYVSDLVGPTIDFRVDEGWVVGPSGNGPIFTLEYMPAPGAVMSVTRFDGETFLDSCDSTSMTVVDPSVPRLTEIISGNPFLNPGPVEVVEVDGYNGLRVDVGVPAFDATDCALPYVLIWAIPVGEGGEFVQMADQQSRFVVLDVGGDVIVIAIETFPGVPFGGFLEASMELVESMDIEPGAWVPPAPTPTPAPSPSPAAAGSTA
jgi:hypothetical protein